MTSPDLIEGHAYQLLRSNRLACLDLASGKERWTSGRAAANEGPR